MPKNPMKKRIHKGPKPRKKPARRPSKSPHGPRKTAQGRPFTRRSKTAPEAESGRPGGETERGGRIPVVAIVGRPNVGKSSLFNRIAGSRIAIEDPRPGTTRDRVSAPVKLRGGPEPRVVELFDTAGVGVVDEEQVQDHVHEQILNGVQSADVVLLVVDITEGLLALDKEAAEMLRRAGRKVVLVANKADDPNLDPQAASLFELGLGEPVLASAKTGRGSKALIDTVIELLPERSPAERLDPPELLLAIVGRRNVGKSTLTNALAADERVIASELQGTTRDSIDVRFSYDGASFVAIDTAGVRRKKALEHSVEFFSQSRSFRAIRRASVVVLMLDATDPISKLDRKLVETALEEDKPLIIAVNKWDLVKDREPGEFRDYITRKLGAADFAPLVFLSSKTGQNVFAIVDIARELHHRAGIRVGTGELNRIIQAAFERHHPQPRKSRLGRIFYATQVSTFPPKIVVFVNDPELFPENWRTYLLHQLQKEEAFAEIPVRLKFKAREKVRL